jgi:hypothetical protein
MNSPARTLLRVSVPMAAASLGLTALVAASFGLTRFRVLGFALLGVGGAIAAVLRSTSARHELDQLAMAELKTARALLEQGSHVAAATRRSRLWRGLHSRRGTRSEPRPLSTGSSRGTRSTSIALPPFIRPAAAPSWPLGPSSWHTPHVAWAATAQGCWSTCMPARAASTAPSSPPCRAKTCSALTTAGWW